MRFFKYILEIIGGAITGFFFAIGYLFVILYIFTKLHIKALKRRIKK